LKIAVFLHNIKKQKKRIMKKILCLVAFSAVLLTSCSSSDSSSTPVTESDVLVTKTVETYAYDNSTITTNYTYDGKKIVSSSDSDGVYENYTYTGDLITNVKTYDDTNALIVEEFLTYNGSGQLVTYLSKDYENDHGRKEVFVHNSNNTVSYSVYKGDNSSQTTLSETGTIHLTNGEVTQIDTTVLSPSYSGTRVYTYDTKNNPFKNITGGDKINFINEEAIGVFRNILTDHYTSTFPTDEMFTTTYTYNSLDFPLTESEIEGTDPSTVVTTQYTYNN
jgi:PBP1b-binding outer membrane lipoprotein LpoB